MTRFSTTALALPVALLLASPALRAQSSPAPSSDPKALALADEVLKALGGQAAWDTTRFLRFDFAVEREGKVVSSRAHTWDKHTGRYRVEGKTQEGDAFTVLMNINTKDGSAWLKGAKVEGEELKKSLERGYAVWVNDTYWLLMPYKMRDPGVILSYAGEEKGGDGTCDKVQLRFQNVGLTPQDTYWAWINRDTKLVDRWDYILKGGPGPATSWAWKGWKRYGSIMLAPDRVNLKDQTRIFFPVLEVPVTVADERFTTP